MSERNKFDLRGCVAGDVVLFYEGANEHPSFAQIKSVMPGEIRVHRIAGPEVAMLATVDEGFVDAGLATFEAAVREGVWQELYAKISMRIEPLLAAEAPEAKSHTKTTRAKTTAKRAVAATTAKAKGAIDASQSYTARAIKLLEERHPVGMKTTDVGLTIGQDPKAVHSTLRWAEQKGAVKRADDGLWYFVQERVRKRKFTLRTAIVNVLSVAERPLSTKIIFERLREHVPGVTLKKVQPEVSRLLTEGLIKNVGGPGNHDREYVIVAGADVVSAENTNDTSKGANALASGGPQ